MTWLMMSCWMLRWAPQWAEPPTSETPSCWMLDTETSSCWMLLTVSCWTVDTELGGIVAETADQPDTELLDAEPLHRFLCLYYINIYM